MPYQVITVRMLLAFIAPPDTQATIIPLYVTYQLGIKVMIFLFKITFRTVKTRI